MCSQAGSQITWNAVVANEAEYRIHEGGEGNEGTAHSKLWRGVGLRNAK